MIYSTLINQSGKRPPHIRLGLPPSQRVRGVQYALAANVRSSSYGFDVCVDGSVVRLAACSTTALQTSFVCTRLFPLRLEGGKEFQDLEFLTVN